VGGRLYLAKDSRQSLNVFQRCYRNHEILINHAKIKNVNKKFNSDLLDRIGINN